ncbi:MAG: hypothetical protein FWD17_19745, partial [Polyangiaceae bacterium]|nr:hypothetical protein [Polyangiaceae bacterium]
MMTAPDVGELALPVESTTIIEAAEMYARAGFAPVPLYGLRADGSCMCGNSEPQRSRGKHPIG